jgi:hypothetical protein
MRSNVIDRNRPAGTSALQPDAYGDEVMNANWNPAVAAMAANDAGSLPAMSLDEDLAVADVENFLGRIYALASQI